MRTDLAWMVAAGFTFALPASAQDLTVEGGLCVTRLIGEPAEVTTRVSGE
ncbi:MAG: hypothetical protein IIC35_07990 [Gemmatimonadetes bacterium]|nr:hypothetical protein [Gemmatimonadota bacterium]